MTWIANLLVLVGLYLIGRKIRCAFLFSAVGEAIWTVCSASEGRWDLASICAVFTVMAVWNYVKWGRTNEALSTQ